MTITLAFKAVKLYKVSPDGRGCGAAPARGLNSRPAVLFAATMMHREGKTFLSCRSVTSHDNVRFCGTHPLVQKAEHTLGGRFMLEVEGFILVGGASSRMGADKAGLRLGGRSFVERIAGALQSVTENIRLVGAVDEAARHGLPVVGDVYRRWGALGGLHAALAHARAPWAAVVACDLPFVTGELFMRLASLRENFDAVVPVQPCGRPQPLCALYRRETCAARAAELIAAGERRPRRLLEQIETRWVATEELAGLRRAALFFTNVNTPEDFAQARERDERARMNDE
jgi:molybdenum cofactor guanylyltransferase